MYDRTGTAGQVSDFLHACSIYVCLSANTVSGFKVSSLAFHNCYGGWMLTISWILALMPNRIVAVTLMNAAENPKAVPESSTLPLLLAIVYRSY